MFIKHKDKPQLITVIGLPGSGINELIRKIKIPSSDGCNIEKLLQVNDATKKAAKQNIMSGKDVVIDIAAMTKRQRIAFLAEFKNLDCYKTGICVLSPYESCVERTRCPDIKERYHNWAPPHIAEGYDHMMLVFNDPDQKMKTYTVEQYLQIANDFDQNNKHHSLSLGAHCIQAATHIAEKMPNETGLITAALLHDNGKLNTKTGINAKGVDDGQSHYYQHNCVGAYNSMFYTKNMGFTDDEILDIANVIYFHMHTRVSWKQSTKAQQRDQRNISPKVLAYIQELNEADVFAHKKINREVPESVMALMNQNQEFDMIDRSDKN